MGTKISFPFGSVAALLIFVYMVQFHIWAQMDSNEAWWVGVALIFLFLFGDFIARVKN